MTTNYKFRPLLPTGIIVIKHIKWTYKMRNMVFVWDLQQLMLILNM